MQPIFENLFVFEMANNHQGEIKHGIAIIEALADIARRHSIRAAIMSRSPANAPTIGASRADRA